MLKTILENIPNVGEVEVHSPGPLAWRVTFLTELGDIDMALAENKVFDDGMVAGTVGITKVSAGVIPANSAYGFEIVSDLNEHTTDGSIHYLIEHLVPGMKVRVRVSAGNQVGFGPRRKTAPEFSSPTLQRPDDPTSMYSEDLHTNQFTHHRSRCILAHRSTMVCRHSLHLGSSPTFDSSALGDRSSLRSAQTKAASQVYSSCVSDFDLSTKTFTYSGS